MSTPTILTIVGSLRSESFNGRLMKLATGAAAERVSFDTYDGLRTIPPFDQDEEADPDPAVADLHARIKAADGVLIATPEYNGSLPGQLKNALDWASRPYDTNTLRGKPVAAIGTSPGRGGARRSLDELRVVMGRIGAEMIEEQVTVATAHENLDDPELPVRLAAVVDALVTAVEHTES